MSAADGIAYFASAVLFANAVGCLGTILTSHKLSGAEIAVGFILAVISLAMSWGAAKLAVI